MDVSIKRWRNVTEGVSFRLKTIFKSWEFQCLESKNWTTLSDYQRRNKTHWHQNHPTTVEIGRPGRSRIAKRSSGEWTNRPMPPFMSGRCGSFGRRVCSWFCLREFFILGFTKRPFWGYFFIGFLSISKCFLYCFVGQKCLRSKGKCFGRETLETYREIET